MYYGGLTKRFQKGTILATGLETSFGMFWQIMAGFCPCAKNLLEDKLKGFELFHWQRRCQHSLVLALLCYYHCSLLGRSIMKKNKWGKKKQKMHSLRRERAPRNLMLGSRSVLKEIRRGLL